LAPDGEVAFVFEAGADSFDPGGGRSGGRSVPFRRFCTSISENNIEGAAAATGT